MSDIGVEQGRPISFIPFSMYIDKYGKKKYLEKSDRDSMCLFNMVAVILLYAVNLSRTKIMIFGHH